jgi:hypothetical protein
MAYEDDNCVCGGKKDRETMLCAECQQAFAAAPEMKHYQDPALRISFRRSCAIALLAMARRRKTNFRPETI